MTAPDPSRLTDPLEPHVELELLGTPWVIADYNSGLRSVAQAEIARLKALLALTSFLLESAADEALSAHREVEKLTYELTRWRPQIGPEGNRCQIDDPASYPDSGF